MTVYGLFNDGTSVLSAEKLRQVVALFAENFSSGGLGVVGGVRLSVTSPNAMKVATGVSGLTVTVQPGMCCIPPATTGAGAYILVNDASLTVTLDTADGSQARYDRIIAKVTDTGSASSVYEITKVPGSPAASPAVPATPSNALSLGYVLVPAGAATPGALTVTDTRVPLSSINRPVNYFNMYEPTSAYTAQTSSTSFVALLRARVTKRAPNIFVSCLQATPSGTTGEIKLMVNGVQVGSTDSTVFGSGEPPNLFGPIPAGIDYGATMDVQVQVRVVTGAGPMSIKFQSASTYF